MRARAAVLVGKRHYEIREFAVPDEIRRDEALLAVEGSGICGSDYTQYIGSRTYDLPLIPGHEPVGRIAKIGREASRIWGIKEGDRVAVEPFAPCGVCAPCVEGRYQVCRNRFVYGYINISVEPSIWGGYGEYMWLRPNSILHKLPPDMTIEDAVLFNPLGAGFEWALKAAGTRTGDSIVIMGPGQRGLACAMAAAEAGAQCIIVTGIARDGFKLELAKCFGATHTVNVHEENLVERVRDITGGEMVDRVVDTSPHATQPVADAIDLVKQGGTIVVGGVKGIGEKVSLEVDKIVLNDLKLRGVVGVSHWGYAQAIRTIASYRYPTQKLHTHTVTIDEVDRAVRLLGGEVDGEQALHITVVPR